MRSRSKLIEGVYVLQLAGWTVVAHSSAFLLYIV